MTLDTRHITTDRCRQFVRTAGTSGPAVVCIHGNLSTSVFWEETMTALAGRARLWAPDLRGFGQTEPLPIDATRGLLDFTDDLAALFKAEGLGAADPVHLIGWSVGGAVAMQLAMALPDTAASLTLINPMSPFGFGGTRDAQGTPTTEDFAGSGGGTANPDLVQRLADQDRSQDSPTSPLSIMLAFYINPSCTLTHQSDLLGAMLDVRIGDDHYPGDSTPSPHWPG